MHSSSSNSNLTSSLPFILDGFEPDPTSIGQCTSPTTNDIISCYNGGDTNLYCWIFSSISKSLSSHFIVNNNETEGLLFVQYPQILCVEKEYIVFYLRENYEQAFDIAYTRVNLDGSITSQNRDISLNASFLTQFSVERLIVTSFNTSSTDMFHSERNKRMNENH